MTFAPKLPPLPWYKRLYYKLEPRFIFKVCLKIQTYFFLKRMRGVALPLVRTPYKEFSAKDFVSVQPMQQASGLVFHLDFVEPIKQKWWKI